MRFRATFSSIGTIITEFQVTNGMLLIVILLSIAFLNTLFIHLGVSLYLYVSLSWAPGYHIQTSTNKTYLIKHNNTHAHNKYSYARTLCHTHNTYKLWLDYKGPCLVIIWLSTCP